MTSVLTTSMLREWLVLPINPVVPISPEKSSS